MRVARAAPAEEIACAQVVFVSLEIGRVMDPEARLFPRRKIRAQGNRDSLGQFALQAEEIKQFAIEGIRPDVRIRARIDQLDVDAHAISRAPHRAFQNVSHSEGQADLAQVARARFVLANRSPADDFQVGDLGQVREDIILDAIREILILLIVAQIFEWQHRDAFFRDTRCAGFGQTAQLRRAAPRSGGRSSVRLTPCGVRSKAQARIMATGKPRTSSIITSRTVQIGTSKNGKTCVAIWMSSQLTTA